MKHLIPALGLLLATAAGAAAQPPNEVLFDKVADTGRELGFHPAYQDRTEGLFIWRITVAESGGAQICNGFFVWYLKPAADTVEVIDGAPLPGCTVDAAAMQGATQRLKDDFRRRWLAAVGDVTLVPGTPQDFAPGLAEAVLGLLYLEPGDRVLRAPPPTAPAGFAWRRLPEINAAILTPEGWFVKRVTGRGGVSPIAYFVTREEIDATGAVPTGLSLNVLVARSHEADSDTYAKSVIAGVATRAGVALLRPAWAVITGAFHQFGCLVREPGKDGPIVVDHTVIVNEATKTTYVVTFESPESDWKDVSEKGAKMVQLLFLDPGI